MVSGYSTNYVRVYSEDASPGEVRDVTASKIFKKGVR